MLRTRLIAGSTAGFVLSAVFATVLSLVHVVDALVEPLRVVPGHPAPITLRIPELAFAPAAGDVNDGSATQALVVPRGANVRLEDALRVQRYEHARRPVRPGYALGVWFVYFLIAMMMTTYLRRLSPGRGALLRTQVGLLGLTGSLLAAAKLYLLLTPLPEFAIPAAAMPIWVALFFDRRGAFTTTVSISFLIASLMGFNLVALAVFLASGVTALVIFRDLKHPTQMLWAGAISAGAASLALVAARLMLDGEFDLAGDLALGVRSSVLAAAAGGVLSGVIAFALQGVAVLVLGAVSRARLQDLMDLDHPLLQRLATDAPGTWEHSRAMANLAEEAAAAIGADALLTRVGAYYHDVGKTTQPKYYVENLQAGETSPHSTLEPDVSADTIMAHVVEGTRILRNGGVPEPVVEFAYSHHGTSAVEYFWHQCLEQGNPKNLDEAFFHYPGMRPRTKETAILMLLDSVEAAARTLDPPSREKFEELVQRLVFVKLRQGQLDESGLTLEDLRVLVARIAETLTSVYHSRIRYPWQERKERGDDELPMPGTPARDDASAAFELQQARRSSRPPPPPFATERGSTPPPGPGTPPSDRPPTETSTRAPSMPPEAT